ncbi:hypothetical protein AS029_05460 [Microbacterium enclense]|nr:hypothetical protein AS029_05460 [Microbacterium enclense]
MEVIAGELQDRDYGIVVLTRDNLNSPWVNFEAGALGKSLGLGKVAPLLVDVSRADVEGPIAQFQSTLLTERDDMRQFVRDLALLVPGLPEATIDTMFGAKWDELDSAVASAGVVAASPKTTRTAESMLEEVLEHVRALAKMPLGASIDEDAQRLFRVDLLAERFGSSTFHYGDAYHGVIDYNPATEAVLINNLARPGGLLWVAISEGEITPF